MDRTVIEKAETQFGDDPSTAQTAPAVTATLVEGRARLSGGPFTFDSDLPPIIGGGSAAPSPTAYLLGALAGCAVAFIHDVLAPQFDVVLDDISAVARCGSDLRGLLGMEGSDPRLTDLSLEITIESSSERVDELREAWLDRCPIYLSLIEAANVEVTWADA
jgi:uncharacterized OsmC-like protein